MQIELQVFSGRPNPRWSVFGVQASDLIRRLRSLHVEANEMVAPGLGFHGFVIHNSGSRFWVYKLRVTVFRSKTKRVFQDTAGVEAFLVAQARSLGLDNLLPPIDQL